MGAPFTLGMFRPLAARVMNSCATDSRIPDYANEAERRLLDMCNPVGSVVRAKICTNSSCITWPRQIATILGYAMCSQPGTIRDRWYEFSPSGPGLRDECCGDPNNLITRDPAPTFDEPWDNLSYVGLQCDVGETITDRVLIQGYDGNGQFIRLFDALTGKWVDGFYLSLSTTIQVSPVIVSSITRVVLPGGRNSMARLYQCDVNGVIVKPLGFYESDEKVPWYRRSFIPNLANSPNSSTTQGCSCSGGGTITTCSCKQVTVQAKLQHIDVADDNDWFVLQNMDALKNGVRAILKEERNLDGEATVLWALARELLDNEKDNYEVQGVTTVFNVVHPSVFGAGGIENYVTQRV